MVGWRLYFYDQAPFLTSKFGRLERSSSARAQFVMLPHPRRLSTRQKFSSSFFTKPHLFLSNCEKTPENCKLWDALLPFIKMFKNHPLCGWKHFLMGLKWILIFFLFLCFERLADPRILKNNHFCTFISLNLAILRNTFFRILNNSISCNKTSTKRSPQKDFNVSY